MSQEERKVITSMISTLLVYVVYCVLASQLYLSGFYDGVDGPQLIGQSILLLIISNVIFHGLITGVLGLINRGPEVRSSGEMIDERDQLIEQKGISSAYLTFGMGFLISMAILALGGSIFIVFNMIALSIIVAEIVGRFQRLMHYRKGI